MSLKVGDRIAAVVFCFLTASTDVFGAEVTDGRLATVSLPREVATEVHRQRSVFVSMRDGVRLSTDIYLPRGVPGPLPTIMIRTPYDKSTVRRVEEAEKFARHGFSVVLQDHRGKFESEGRYFLFPRTDGQDGYDTIEWIARQSWSTGRVGTFGCSYLGETQHTLARERHPRHLAAIAQAGSSYGGEGVRNFGFQRYGATELVSAGSWAYQNGANFYLAPPADVDRAQWFSSAQAKRYSVRPFVPAEDLRFGMFWRLPVADLLDSVSAPYSEWRNWLAKAPGDSYWQQQAAIVDTDRFDVPTLHMNGWYDLTPNSTLALFRLFRENAESKRAAEHQHLIMYAGEHCNFVYGRDARVGERSVGNAALDAFPIYIAWFDHWLKDVDNGITRVLPKVLSYALGVNEWRAAEVWPPPNVRETRWFLTSGGDARSRWGSGKLSRAPVAGSRFDRYSYDPSTPVEALGGGICCAGPDVKYGAVDQRQVENRADVLVYTSEELMSALSVAGRIRVVLQVSADVRDTDLVARLTDVQPDGTSYNVTEGILRLRYREGLEREVFMQPGRRYAVEIDLESTHNVFLPGHRVRLHVTSSAMPRWDRNLNTGGRNYDERAGVVAQVSIHHGPGSYLILPVQQ